MKPQAAITDAATGITIQRDMTDAEIQQREKDSAAAAAVDAAKQAALEARESARAKLAALGLTEAELKTLLGA